MIKRTLHFGNPVYLGLRNGQLTIKLPEVEKNSTLPEDFKENNITTIPVEDIGVLVLEHPQITITHSLLGALLDNNTAVLTCNSIHMPSGLLLPLEGNTVQSERFKDQIGASEPLRKQLWQQTIKQKILNQASLLSLQNADTENMRYWATQVRSGDPDNYEGRAAAYYWSHLFANKVEDFHRNADGLPPNNLLNYGYAILRAVVSRGLVASGLLPTLGIHHHNRYNAYCLADDIMEPFRPFVDKIVVEILLKEDILDELKKEHKIELLQIPVLDVEINGRRSPLMIAVQQTTSSLAKCYMGEERKIIYPVLQV